MGRYFTASGGVQRWIHILQEVNTAINNSVHSTIGVAPSAITRKNARVLFDYLEQKRSLYNRKRKSLVGLGDVVRIAKSSNSKKNFVKGFKEKWSRDLFQVIQIHQGSKVPTFSLVNSFGHPQSRRYYENELNVVIPISEMK